MVFCGELTEQLRELARSMESCQEEWRSFISDMRSRFRLLNHYTSEQMVYLCHWIHKACLRQASVPQQLWHLLHPIKPQCSLADVKAACTNAATMASKWQLEDEAFDDGDQHQGSASPMPAQEEPQDLMEFSSEDEDDGVMSCDDGHSDDSIEKLWKRFKADMPQYLSESLDVSTLAHFLSCLADLTQQHMIRNLPAVLQEGKPNLVLCPSAEVFTTVLSFYTKSPEQPLPTSDEVLVCREKTTEEEVELFLRRALGQDSAQTCQRIYALVNPGLLGYDVSVALGELFEAFEGSANPRYRLVIVSPVVHQHRYVPSFFSTHKVQAGENLAADDARKYLHHHFTQNTFPQCSVTMVSPDQLSVWVVASVRPAVGKIT